MYDASNPYHRAIRDAAHAAGPAGYVAGGQHLRDVLGHPGGGPGFAGDLGAFAAAAGLEAEPLPWDAWRFRRRAEPGHLEPLSTS